jgi:hypothetical protein
MDTGSSGYDSSFEEYPIFINGVKHFWLDGAWRTRGNLRSHKRKIKRKKAPPGP